MLCAAEKQQWKCLVARLFQELFLSASSLGVFFGWYKEFQFMLLTNRFLNLRCDQKIELIFVILKGFQSHYKEPLKCPFLDCPELYIAY